jgi:hypothetical protein
VAKEFAKYDADPDKWMKKFEGINSINKQVYKVVVQKFHDFFVQYLGQASVYISLEVDIAEILCHTFFLLRNFQLMWVTKGSWDLRSFSTLRYVSRIDYTWIEVIKCGSI